MLICTLCHLSWPVSEEDPDATMSDVIDHLEYRHHRNYMDNPSLIKEYTRG